MSLYVGALVLAACSAFLLWPVSARLARARWVVRAPHAAVALWQAIGISAMVCGMGAGLAVAVERFHRGFFGGLSALWSSVDSGHPLVGLGIWDALGLTLAADLGIVLASVMMFVTIRGARARSRHRHLLDLMSSRVTDARTRVLQHPRAVAYCVPGIRPRIVISEGTIELLPPSELAAVVAHERGHAVERHGLVLLPMIAMAKIFGWVPYVALAPVAMANLLEMAADEYSLRRHEPRSLASALVSMATVGVTPPACSLGMASHDVSRRVERLLSGQRTSKRTAAGALAIGTAVLAAPFLVLVAV